MDNAVRFVLVVFAAFIVAGCCGITTLSGPVNKPEFTGSIDGGKWNFSISIPKGGSLNHKFLNLKHIQGNSLWLSYRLQVFEGGIVTRDVAATSSYRNNAIEGSDLPLQLNISHTPTLSRSGVAILTWKILYSKDADVAAGSAEVLSGSESVGIVN